MSKWDGIVGHPRYVYKKDINYSKIANDLDKSRQTISKRFKEMLEGTKENEESTIAPLVRLSQDGKRYELIALQSNLAMLVPKSTLRVLVSALNDNTISIYVYLFNRYYASGCKEFQFSYKELKNVIGIMANSNGNHYIISSILFILKKIGLLEYRIEKKINEENRIVTECYIEWMTAVIEDLPQDFSEKGRELYKKIGSL